MTFYAHLNKYLEVTSRPGGSDSEESVYNAGDPGTIPGPGRSPEEGNGTYSSFLAWRISQTEEPGGPTDHGITKSWARLSD